MYWNHRAMEREVHGEKLIFIVEVYYNEDDSVMGWTESEEVWSETVDGLRTQLQWMTAALEKPVLIEAELLAQAEQARAEGRDPFGDIDTQNLETMTVEELFEALENSSEED